MSILATQFRKPLDAGYNLTQKYNEKSVITKSDGTKVEVWHLGEDWSNSASGGPVYAIGNGTVRQAFFHTNKDGSDGYGNIVIIEHELPNGSFLHSIYSHLEKLNVTKNQEVHIGDIIGNVGSTGFSTGPHLHLSINLGKYPGGVPVAYPTYPDPDVQTGYVDPTWFFANFIVPQPPGGGTQPNKASIAAASTIEGKTLSFTVTLDKPAAEATKVYYETLANGTASTNDFAGKSGFIEIAKGKSTGVISIATAHDTAFELDETMGVLLKSATNGVTIGAGSGIGTILNDDKAPPPKASIAAASAVEGKSLNFTVTLDKAATETTKVYYETLANGTASKTDFTEKSAFIEITKGNTTGIITVETTPDTRVEADETMRVLLKSATNGVTISTSNAVGTILNDDKAVPVLADFRVQDLKLDKTSIKHGEATAIDFTVRNDGTADSNGSVYQGIYISTKSSFDSTAKLIADDSAGTLSKGEVDDNESEMLTALKEYGPGTYYLFVKADYDGRTKESNEDNNISDSVKLIIAPKVTLLPDLHIAKAWLDDSTLTKGQNLRINLHVENVGKVDAEDTKTSFYWSPNNHFDPKSDKLIGSETHGTLDAGEVDKNEYEVISSTIIAKYGSGYIFAVIDSANETIESNENNNVSDPMAVWL